MKPSRSWFAAAALLVAAGVGLVFWPRAAVAEQNPPADPSSCGGCHRERFEGWNRTPHAEAGGTCLSCHPGETLHQRSADRRAGMYDALTCAVCHEAEYREWQQSAHHQPVPFTRDEIAPELITDCVKCHHAAGYAEVLRSGRVFATAKGSAAAAASAGVTCAACHDPHAAGSPALLRVGSPAGACDTCHGSKWQNLVLNGTGGQRYPDSSYHDVSRSPHDTGSRCVACHMARSPGVSAGGHTLKMREPGGRPHTAPCIPCHAGIRDFDVGGKQEEVKGLLRSLEEALKARNGGELPGFQPGKCNRCHRGGTLPFKDDPAGVLEQAFQNYRLFLNDRSRGVHNPAYTVRLLQESLQHVTRGYPGAGENEADQACASCGH